MQQLKKLFFFAIALAALFYIFTYEEKGWFTTPSWSVPLSGMVIVLDPGHGGMDGGAVSKDGLVEKEITLKIAKKLRDYLQQSGAVVLLTREEDKDLADGTEGTRKRQDLRVRAELVNQSGAELFISIHLNSIPSSQWRGAQTFYNPTNPENRRLAKLIQQELIKGLGNTDRLEKKDQDIFILKAAKVPAVLVEAGFLSNPEEAALLGNEAYQSKIAESIYRGILRYTSGEQVEEEKR
ncbi:N-acetylmuramoyl-L-alanine amidase [[Clostridium] ultunense Esp]|nr:N-acetylmuramoyl-L-alanine amidase [[Clostridium] ultunense Esp]